MKKKKSKTKSRAKKLKLMPTLRENRHYLIIIIEGKINTEKAKEVINKAILSFIGIIGYAKAGPIFVETGEINNKKIYFIVSVTTKYVDKVKASVALIHEPELFFRCVGVSGTLKKSKRFLK